MNVALWAYRTSFRTSLGCTPFHLVHGEEALLPIEVELSSLRVLLHSQKKGKGALKECLLDLERLALNKDEAIRYYARHAKARRKRFKRASRKDHLFYATTTDLITTKVISLYPIGKGHSKWWKYLTMGATSSWMLLESCTKPE